MKTQHRPDCIAYVYGEEDQKRKLLVLSREWNMSASACVVAMIEKRYAELYGDTPAEALLVRHTGS